MFGFNWKQMLFLALFVVAVSVYVQPRIQQYFPKA